MLVLDDIDRGLVHALHLDGRTPFTKVAAVLGTSTQTVARRYARLRADAGLRVVALPNLSSAGRQQWIVRLTATARTAQEIGSALARRTDTSWVRLTSGGTEIVAIIHTTPGSADSHALLLRDIPRTTSVTAVSAHYLLHTYLGGPTAWHGRVDALSRIQRDQLRLAVSADPVATPITLGDRDHLLLAVLLRDGRASLTDLATHTGWSASTVTRRLDELRRAGALFFDVEIDDSVFGITASAVLWMSIAPAHLDQVATALAGHEELAVVAATTGPTNLLAHALCRDSEALHHYLTTRLALDAITRIETAPVLRTIKGIAPVQPT
jgi:DNA-binding Lrp family transcriptional regulator